MYINDNTHIQTGWLDGFGLGIIHYDPQDDSNIIVDEDELWEEYNILFFVFFIKITLW